VVILCLEAMIPVATALLCGARQCNKFRRFGNSERSISAVTSGAVVDSPRLTRRLCSSSSNHAGEVDNSVAGSTFVPVGGKKQRVLSGVQPTGALHLGNYVGMSLDINDLLR
jgi:hypothetical protein